MLNEISGRNFGLLIAYVIPGLVGLWAASYFSETVGSWLQSSDGGPTVGGFLYLSLASIAAGVTISAIRWAVVDSIHHATGLLPPDWNMLELQNKLQAFQALVEDNYRYYQFYANMFIAVCLLFVSWRLSAATTPQQAAWATLGFIVLELLLFAGSRDCLRRYYVRTRTLFGTSLTPERSGSHDQWFPPREEARKERRQEAASGQQGPIQGPSPGQSSAGSVVAPRT